MHNRLRVVFILLFCSSYCFAQTKDSDQFTLLEYNIKLEKEVLTAITKGCDGTLNILTVNNKTTSVFAQTICTAEVGDVRFLQKGYLTIIEHYSSPVGWTVYYIFDLCKGSFIKTKQIDEGIKLVWHDFINPTAKTQEKYIESITKF